MSKDLLCLCFILFYRRMIWPVSTTASKRLLYNKRRWLQKAKNTPRNKREYKIGMKTNRKQGCSYTYFNKWEKKLTVVLFFTIIYRRVSNRKRQDIFGGFLCLLWFIYIFLYSWRIMYMPSWKKRTINNI